MFRKILSGKVTRRILIVMSGMCTLVLVGLCTYALAAGGKGQGQGQGQSDPPGASGGGGQGGVVVSDDLAGADSAIKAGDYKLAAQLYGKAVQAGGTRDEQLRARKGLVMVRIGTGKSQEAAAGLQELKADHKGEPGLGAAVCEVADTYDRVHQYRQAQTCYKDVLTASSSTAEERTLARRGLAMSAISMGHLEDAAGHVAALAGVCAGEPIAVQAIQQVGYRYYTAGLYEQAETLYKQVLVDHWDHPIAAETRERLAFVYIRTGRYDQAEQVTDELKSSHSDDPALASYLRRIAYLWMDIGQYDRAASLYRQVLSQFPDNPICDQCGAELLQTEVLAAVSDKQGGNGNGLDTVAGELKRADVSKGAMVDAMVKAGKVCRWKGQDQAAMGLFEKAASGPGQDLVCAQAKVLALIALGRDSEADSVIKSLVKTHADAPNLAVALLEIGSAISGSAYSHGQAGAGQVDQAKVERASVVLERIKDLPIHTEATIHGRLALAKTLLSQGDLSGARAEFEYIIETWPDHPGSGHASLILGRCYDLLASEKGISESEAFDKKHKVYAAWVDRYPLSPAGKAAKQWLEMVGN